MNAKGYKGFNKGMICRGKQYKENTIFEEPEAEICNTGMHYCKNPFDVLDHYDLVNENGSFNEFAEVEPMAEEKTDDNKKFCTTKLKIGAKFSFSGFVKACVDFTIEQTKFKGSSGDFAQIGSSGDVAKIGSSGDWAQIGSSGDGAKIGSSGYGAKIGSSGYRAQISSSGYGAKIGSSGDGAQIGSSGDVAQIGSSGDVAQIGSSGDWAQIGSSGDGAQIGSSGYGAKIGSSGDWAQIGSSGDWAKIGSSGYGAKIGSSGYGAKIGSSGEYAVIMCAGNNCMAKAKKGSFITLAEWRFSDELKRAIPVNVVTKKVDGEHIKEDTFYKLKNGEFVEAEES